MKTRSSETYAGKLIWQETSPAPFESGWSIFSKLIGLNAIGPRKIAQLICKPEFKEIKYLNLKYKDGKWIDFEKFGELLNINPNRLKFGFLDSWGDIQTEYIYTSGEKRCNSCLAVGYHNVFFELGFIEICPWHNEKLEYCKYCFTTVYRKGLNAKPLASSNIKSDWTEWSSECAHINVHDKKIANTNLLSDIQSARVKEISLEFSDWWNQLKIQPEIFHFLAKTNFSKDESEFLGIFLNAAEQIAGSCPWPLDNERYPVKTLNWHTDKQYCERYDKQNSSASRASLWGINYRTIRRHLFCKYIKPHKSCWNFLINTHAYNLSHFNRDTACHACIAFATWRLLNENLLVLEGFKNPKIRTFYIKLFELVTEDYVQSNRAHSNLLYAQFFSIWQMINTKSLSSKIAINVGNGHYKNYIPSITYNNICTIIIPSPSYLLDKSIEHCDNRKKKGESVFYPNFSDDWFEHLNYHYLNDNKVLFKMYKSFSMRSLYYLNL